LTTASAEPALPSRGLRQVIARHPVAAMLLLMFVIGWAFLVPAALAGVPLIPLPLLGAVFLAQLGPALTVTWASGGWPDVRRLFARTFRWRVHLVWYLIALLAIPISSLLWTAAAFGGGAVHTLITNASVIEDYLSSLTILPIVTLWEETAWMGVVQARLANYRGPVVAALITGPLFGLLHMPLELGQPLGPFLLSMAGLVLLAIPFRMVLGWVYNLTGGSVLLVALVHVTFDATNNTRLLVGAAPGVFVLQPGGGAVHLVVLAWAIVVLVLTRGRLGTRQPAQSGTRA
jgi:uncharacterized protein